MFYLADLSGQPHTHQLREPDVTALSKNELHSNDACQLSRCDIATVLTLGTGT